MKENDPKIHIKSDVNFKKIKLLALDFDGTLTLGAFVFVSENGQESVICSRRDSLGIEMLKQIGIEVVVISKETNKVVSARCQKMNIECYQGVSTDNDKLSILKRLIQSKNLVSEQTAYIGDDVNDILCIKHAGMGIATADAHKSVKDKADYITKSNGGVGAVREVCDLILETKQSKKGD